MIVRNELNEALYRQKMDDFRITEPFPKPPQLAAISEGRSETIRAMLGQGELSLDSDNRILSKNGLRNSLFHFVMCASEIAGACINAGMGRSEACTLSDLYILKADNCGDVEAIRRLYEEMCMDFSERMGEIRKESVVSLHVRKCIDHIYENLGADLSVNALAEKAGLHPAYLSRLFRKETGVPLKQFVKEARVDTARNLLRYSQLPYPIIATSLGFSSQSAFIAVFRQITGTTPKVFRETFSTPRI